MAPAAPTAPIPEHRRRWNGGEFTAPATAAAVAPPLQGRSELQRSGGGMGTGAGNGKEEAKKTGLEGAGLSLPGGSHGNLHSAGGDTQLRQMLDSLKSMSPAVINYGASCQVLPSFCKFSNEFKNLNFIYADIDECPETTQNIRYTPTFHFYRDGERVDEMLGTGEERLHDRLWLHS